MKRYVLGIVAILTLVTACAGIDQPISLKLGRKEYLYLEKGVFGPMKISNGYEKIFW